MNDDTELIEKIAEMIDITHATRELPDDEREYAREGDWRSFSEREAGLRRIRAAKIIQAVRSS